MNLLPCSVAAVTSPLFESPWQTLFTILICGGLLLAVVLGVKRWLTGSRPQPPENETGVLVAKSSLDSLAAAMPVIIPPPVVPVPAAPAAVVVATEISPEILAIIAAVVRATLGAGARIAQVAPHSAVETLMQQWSMEGRRQIYSSHQIR